MTDYLAIVEQTLEEVLPHSGTRPKVLFEGMRYAVGAGGKRIRPIICLAAAEAVGGNAEDAKYPAAAIELLHNYTLVHDDLPAMDNDTERRGKPSVWAKYGEANGILIGDALIALSFKVAAKTPRNVGHVVDILGAKGVGVVAGQVEDIDRKPGAIDFIYEHKTADLFMAAAVMGGYAGGGSAADIGKLLVFSLNLGLAFQYEDDLLDGDSPYPKAETEDRIRKATDAAVKALEGMAGDTSYLRGLALKLAGRSV